MVDIPTYDDQGMSLLKKKGLEDSPEPAGTSSGIDQDPLIEGIPIYQHAGCETVFSGDNNTYIVMGRDRPGGFSSGYGSRTNSHSGCIDIIAGLSGPLVRETSPSNSKKVYTNKSTVLDAARIYISQRCDIDKYFYCPLGSVGDSEGKSGIAIKADAIRIIGREGIKLWAGGDKYSSRGPRAAPAGIDLIGGTGEITERTYNKGQTGTGLQPLVKGNNLVAALQELADFTVDTIDMFRGLAMDNLLDDLVDAIHVHPVVSVPPVTAPAPTAATKIAKVYKWYKLFNDLGIWPMDGGVIGRVNWMARVARHRTRFYNTNSVDCILSHYNTTN
tara:strand:+ start:3416 stop:4408 length:993 start_codon:yes stop_codon:yes gene_type:complete